MLTTNAKLLAIFVIILSSKPIYSFAASSQANNQQMTSKYSKTATSESATQVDLTEVILSRLDIMLGFFLGLSSTLLVDYLRKRKRMKTFREGARTELRQILANVNGLSINSDCKITKEKIQSWTKLMKEFDLSKVISPFEEHSFYETLMKKDFQEEDFVGFIKLHDAKRKERNEAGKCQDIGKLSYSFIQNNISSLSLLPKTEQALLLNILRRLDAINQKISSVNFSFEKTFDSGITDSGHKRLRYNYLSTCQFISDFSFAAAREISYLLRL